MFSWVFWVQWFHTDSRVFIKTQMLKSCLPDWDGIGQDGFTHRRQTKQTLGSGKESF